MNVTSDVSDSKMVKLQSDKTLFKLWNTLISRSHVVTCIVNIKFKT